MISIIKDKLSHKKGVCMFVKPRVSQGGEIFQNKQDSYFLILEWKRVHKDAAWHDYIFLLQEENSESSH